MKEMINNMWSIKSLEKTVACVLLGIALIGSCAWGEDANNPGKKSTAWVATGEVVSVEGWTRPQYPTSIYYSTGDAIVFYDWIPMNTKATINAALDIFAKRYNCDRLLWRDTYVEWVARYDRIRKDAPWLGEFVKGGIRISRENKTTEYAAQAAKAKGMQFWGIFALYDYCGKAESGADAGNGAFWSESPLLISHPEYCLWDRAHTTWMTGIIEYGYPDVRKEYVHRMEEMFKGPWKDYEGIFMYSFIENSECHYPDEYIYSDIACNEYKKRYGVDPRTEPFDLDKYYAIRGEYITEYLRDLRPLFKKYKKKLAISLNADNMEWPQRWIGGQQDSLFVQQGRIKWDWRTWVKEGLVDELNVWGGASLDKKFTNVRELLDATKGTGVKITGLFQRDIPEAQQPFYMEGLRRVVCATPSDEDGYAEKRPVSDIDSHDTDAVLSVLTQARKKEVDVPVEQIAALLLKHPNPMVRRQAAKTIGAMKLQDGVAALENAAIKESEPSVKAMVFDALGKVNGHNSVAAIAKGFGKVNTFPVRMALYKALAAMGPDRYADVAKAYDTKDDLFRTVLLQSFARKDGVSQYFPVIKRAILDDSQEQARWWAAKALTGYRSQETLELLYKAMDDKLYMVQNRAVQSIGVMLSHASPEMKQRIFDKLIAKYQEFGAGCKRTDCEWGWRPIGGAIRDGFEVQGKTALLDILNGNNTELAQLTWRVFFQPNDDRWHPIAKDDMEKRYRFYPGGADHGKCSLADVEAAIKKP